MENKDFDIVQFKEILTANKDNQEVKSFLKEIVPIEKDVLDKIPENDEGKKWLQSVTDKRVTEAIKTYKENHFEEEVKVRVDQEMIKRNPRETDDQKRIREVELKLQKQEKEKRFAELKAFALQFVANKNQTVPEKIMNKLVSDNEDETRENLEAYFEDITFRTQQSVNKTMTAHAHTPQGGDKEDLPFASLDEYGKYLQRNPGKYDSVLYAKIAAQGNKK